MLNSTNVKLNSSPTINGINVCYVDYRPIVTEDDVNDLVSFIVVVVKEGFNNLKGKSQKGNL